MTIRYTGHRSKGGCLDIDETAHAKLAADKERLENEVASLKARMHALRVSAEEVIRRVSDNSCVEEAHNAIRAMAATLKTTA
jgi:hypothetical protein